MLEMIDNELYEAGLKVLTGTLGESEALRFIQACKPGRNNYPINRHNLLESQEAIDTIAKRLYEIYTKAGTAGVSAKEIAAFQNEIRERTDIEIYEIGGRVLINKFGITGLIAFTNICEALKEEYPQYWTNNEEETEAFISLYTTSLRFYPKIVETYIKRGNAYHRIKKSDKAIEDYNRAIEINPDEAEAYYYRGNMYRYTPDFFDAAIRDYTTAINLNPGHAEAYYERGSLHTEDNAFDEAIADFSMTIQLDPDDTIGYAYRGLVYQIIGEYDKAIEDFSRMIEIAPGDAEHYSDRSSVYFSNGDYVKAIEDIDIAIQLMPTDSTFYDKRGEIYRYLGEYNRAIKDFSKAVELSPEYVRYYIKRAMAYFRNGNIERSIQDYDRILELDPKFTEAYAIRGIMWLHAREWETAKIDLTFARNLKVDIRKSFSDFYESPVEFESINQTHLPEDIVVMLTCPI